MISSRTLLKKILPLVPLVPIFLLRPKLLRSERPLLLVPLQVMLLSVLVEIPLVTPLRSATKIPSQGTRVGALFLLQLKALTPKTSSPFFAGPYYGTYPEDVVAGNCEFTREEWDASYRPSFGVLTKEVLKDLAACKTIVDQFPTPREMAKGLRGEGYWLDWAGTSSTHLEEVASSAEFERGLSMHQNKDEFADVLKGWLISCLISEYDVEPLTVILQLNTEKLVCLANIPIPMDTCISPPIANESIVSDTVDGSVLEMTDGATHSKSTGIFVRGTSHFLDDVIEVTMVGSEHVSSGLTDVIVAFSASEKGDGFAPSSIAEEGRGAWYAGEHLLLRAWGELMVDVLLSIQQILGHATRRKPNGFPLGPLV
nr:hypothetical protein [Tanacetum cinerariifolium]